MIISKTPLRLSLVGGGTDTPAFYEQVPGAVVSFAISKFVYVAINDKFDGKFRVSYSITENVSEVQEIKHELVRKVLESFRVNKGLEIVSIADIPGSGSGLGSSSAFTVGLVNALGHHLHKNNPKAGGLAEVAYDIESAGHPEIGKQDHYASACGGLNYFKFNKRSVSIHPIYDKSGLEHLEKHLLLLWTGISRSASIPLKGQKIAFGGDGIAIGTEMAKLATELWHQMEMGNFFMVGEYLHENWMMKKSLCGSISTIEIDKWYELARENGAIGGKICGAGGGGFMLFYCHPDAKERISKVTGLRQVDFKIEPNGSEIL